MMYPEILSLTENITRTVTPRRVVEERAKNNWLFQEHCRNNMGNN